MLKIQNLQDGKHAHCVALLEDMFTKFGIKQLDPNKPMQYWVVKHKNPKVSLLSEPVLSVDEEGNQLRAVFFVTRKKKAKKLNLFRFTKLFPALHETEREVSITEAIERFIDEKTDYIPPVMVVLLGKISEGGKLYAGGFLYEVPSSHDICIEVAPKEKEPVEETEE